MGQIVIPPPIVLPLHKVTIKPFLCSNSPPSIETSNSYFGFENNASTNEYKYLKDPFKPLCFSKFNKTATSIPVPKTLTQILSLTLI